MINGYDLDGVLCKNVEWDKDTPLQLKKILRPSFFKHTPKIRDTEGSEIYIITTRKEQYRPETLEWLKRNKIKFHKLLMLTDARTRRNMIKFKKNMIEYYKVDTFYEDDPIIVKALQRQLKTTNVILVDDNNEECKPFTQKELEQLLRALNEKDLFK